ncbi:hypothetical protein [Deinococcus hopiensis]|uniref:hypothetical protein n=1 Tax=Deinococcus hopiensis TaxID=309885 RepID=UPI001FEB62A6|nr:hypothetical protein [Deinococcus hopiensis]
MSPASRSPRGPRAPAVHAAVHASLPELRPWTVWVQAPPDLPGTAENLTRAAGAFTAGENLRSSSGNAGQGYATEVARALTELGLRHHPHRRPGLWPHRDSP